MSNDTNTDAQDAQEYTEVRATARLEWVETLPADADLTDDHGQLPNSEDSPGGTQ